MKLVMNRTASPARRLRPDRTVLLLLAAILPLAMLTQTAAADPSPDEPQGQLPLTGNVSVHDPTMYSDGETYYVSATGGSIRSAPSMEGPWTTLGSVPRADWTSSLPGLFGGLWAPHVQRIDDTFYYYYSTSAFGTNNSAIGLKTTQTPEDPSSYVDIGHPVVTSGSADPDHATFNAIDPAIWPDQNGDWWLVWGSHFEGIMVQQLSEDMTSVVGDMHLVAHRASETFPVTIPGCPYPEDPCPNYNRIEGPSIFYRDGYFYLMTAWDWCCRANGNDNTYKIVIGRSENIFGPYVDKNGIDLAEGGGSIILNSRVAEPDVTPTGLYRAPGAPDVFVEDGTYYLTYHAYRPFNTLGIRPMNWHDGWPYFNEPGGGPYDLQDRAYYRLVNQDGIISDPDSLQNPVASDRCLTAADDGDVIQRQCDDSLEQVWELQGESDGFWRFRSMSETSGHCLRMSDGSGEVGTDVVVSPCDGTEELQEWYLDDTGHGSHRPVAKSANLALEIENVCTPPLSYNCDGVIGTDVVGGVRRDGNHMPGNVTQAAKWPPQQWQLAMAEVTPEIVLAAFDGFVADGRIVGSGPGASETGRLGAVRNMLVSAFGQLDDGNVDAALAQLSDAQARIHVSGDLTAAHFVTGADAGTLSGLIDQLMEKTASS